MWIGRYFQSVGHLISRDKKKGGSLMGYIKGRVLVKWSMTRGGVPPQA